MTTTHTIKPMNNAEMQAEIARLIAENTALKNKPAKTLTLKVSEKGGLSIYGMGRFPVTLYKEQWQKLNAFMPTVMAFVEAHGEVLVSKEQSTANKAAALSQAPAIA